MMNREFSIRNDESGVLYPKWWFGGSLSEMMNQEFSIRNDESAVLYPKWWIGGSLSEMMNRRFSIRNGRLFSFYKIYSNVFDNKNAI